MKPLDVFLSEIFLSLEVFLQKAATLNIFEALIFNYKIKVNSVEKCSPQFVSYVEDLHNELQIILKDSVAREVSSPTNGEKPETTLTELPTASSDFDDFSSSTNEPVQEQGSKDKWEQIECQEAVDKRTEAAAESSTLEKRKEIYTCKYCNRKYRTNGKFSRHSCKSASIANSRDEEAVDDPDSVLSEHASQVLCETETRLELPVYFCSVCLSTYSRREMFDAHTHLDTSQEVELIKDIGKLQSQRKYVCGVCGEVYRSLGRIAYHVARCNTGPYQCELCPHTAPTKILLNKHKKKHHKGVESFFCAECGLGFKLRSSLQKHLVNRHEIEQDSFPCDVEGCRSHFQKKIQLTNHKIKIHGIEKKYLCQVCGHKFMTQDSLSCHLECHNSPKRFQCCFCRKTFNTKEKMTYHVRAHTGEKPFECELCPKSFVSKSKMTQHLQRHKGERRHECDVCGKQYASKPDLTAHLKKIHPAQDFIQEVSLVELNQQSGEFDTELYGTQPQVMLHVDTPSSTGQLFNNVQSVQYYPVPQNMVITSYEAVMGM